MDTRRSEATRLLLLSGIQSDDYQAFWDSLDIGYFLRHEPSDIAWHARVLHRLQAPTAPVVQDADQPDRRGLRGAGLHASTGRACSPGSAATSTARTCRSSRPGCTPPRTGHALDSFMVVDPRPATCRTATCSRWWRSNWRSGCRAASKCPTLKPAGAGAAVAAVARRSRCRRRWTCGRTSRGRRYHLSVTVDRPHRPALRHRAHPRAERHRHLRRAGGDARRARRGHLHHRGAAAGAGEGPAATRTRAALDPLNGGRRGPSIGPRLQPRRNVADRPGSNSDRRTGMTDERRRQPTGAAPEACSGQGVSP